MKPALLPEFIEGEHYRQLHPTKEGHKRWRFITLVGMRLSLPQMAHLVGDSIVVLHDATGRVWGRIDKFGIYIEPGYAWNGCTPKYWIWPFGWCGTPDFKETVLASLFHDFLYQFSAAEHFPLHRSDCDAIFFHCIDMAGAPRLAEIYHGAVMRYGSWADRPRKGEFSTLL